MNAKSRSQMLRRILHHAREEQQLAYLKSRTDNTIDSYLRLENQRLRAKGRKGRLIQHAKRKAESDSSVRDRLKRMGIR